jgi:hypothetical protein
MPEGMLQFQSWATPSCALVIIGADSHSNRPVLVGSIRSRVGPERPPLCLRLRVEPAAALTLGYIPYVIALGLWYRILANLRITWGLLLRVGSECHPRMS